MFAFWVLDLGLMTTSSGFWFSYLFFWAVPCYILLATCYPSLFC